MRSGLENEDLNKTQTKHRSCSPFDNTFIWGRSVQLQRDQLTGSQSTGPNDLICGAPIGPLWLANKFNYLNERCSSTLEEADNNTLVHQNNYPCPSAPIALPQISKSRFSTRVCFWSVKEAMSFPLLPFLFTPLISAPLSTLCAKVIKTLQFLGTMQCCIKRKVILCNPSRVTAH